MNPFNQLMAMRRASPDAPPATPPEPQRTPLQQTALTAFQKLGESGASRRQAEKEVEEESKSSLTIESPDFSLKMRGTKLGNVLSALHQGQREGLEARGFQPEDPENALEDISTLTGAYRESRRMGNARGEAMIAALGLRAGLMNREEFAQDVANERQMQNERMQAAAMPNIAAELNLFQAIDEGRHKAFQTQHEWETKQAEGRLKAFEYIETNIADFATPDEAFAWWEENLTPRVGALSELDRKKIAGEFETQQDKAEKEQRRLELSEASAERAERTAARLEQVAADTAAGRISAEQARQEDKKIRMADALADDYTKEIKPVRDARARLDQIIELAQDPTGAQDVALLYAYMKILDSDSVVRESEFATASNIGSMFSRAAQQYSKAVNGERLTPQNRAALVASAEKMVDAMNKRESEIKGFYREKSTRRGIDPRDIGSDIGGGEGSDADYFAKKWGVD